MTAALTRDELVAAGRRLFGERWQTPLSRAIRVADRTVRRWVAGEWPVPPDAAAKIRALEARHVSDQALDQLDRLIAESGSPPDVIRLTQGRDATGRRATALVAKALRARGLRVEIVGVPDAIDDPEARALLAASKPRHK